MMTLIKEFFLVGLGTFGGGLAMIPIFLDIVTRNGWMNEATFMDLLSISQATPGPIAINMATFVGYTLYAVPGALIASLTIVFPGFVLSTSLGNFLHRHKDSPRIVGMMALLRCSIIGLLLQALLFIGKRAFYVESTISIKAFFIFFIALAVTKYSKLNLGIHILIFAILGMIIL